MAGSADTQVHDKLGSINKLTIDWTSDDATGAVTITTDEKICGELIKVITNPSGTAAPDANYDIVITDAEGFNVLSGMVANLLNRHTANTEEVYFATAATNTVVPVVCDILTISVANAGNSKEGRILLYWRGTVHENKRR